MTESHSVIIAGIPDSGKTNYIIRFWLAVDKGSGRLRSDGVPDDIDYLEAGAEKLLSGEFAPHTPHGVSSHSHIPVRAVSQGKDFRGTLVVPDYHGEEWVSIYKKREWSNTWEELIPRTTGCLFFIRAASPEIVDPLDWITAGRYFGSGENLPDQHDDAQEQVTPTQVMLVEWLQFFRQAFTDLVGGYFKPRIGIVVSAWDFVPEDQKPLGPEAYIELNFPMLKQFVDSNSDRFNVKFFGVSIVGGDLEDKSGFRKEYREGDPSKAGYIVHHTENGVDEIKDLTFPVAWAMGLEAEN
jgi:double-GTPase-like protein